MMAARGLAPLGNAVDLLSVLYQLSIDNDLKIRNVARRTAADLPEKVAAGGLGNTALDPRVLNFFATLVDRDSKLSEQIILNQKTADQTIASVARVATEREVQLIADNEERLLRHPAIITAMYNNENSRASTVIRAIELAVHNEVKVLGIPAWDQHVQDILESGRKRRATGAGDSGDGDPSDETMKDKIQRLRTNPAMIHKEPVPTQIWMTSQGPKTFLGELVRSTKKQVSLAAIRSPKLNESDAVKLAGNQSLSDGVIQEISRRREWTKQYAVKLALVRNPKCPLPQAMRLLPFLREKDIQAIARSKGIPSALNAQARKLLTQRKSGGRGNRR